MDGFCRSLTRVAWLSYPPSPDFASVNRYALVGLGTTGFTPLPQPCEGPSDGDDDHREKGKGRHNKDWNKKRKERRDAWKDKRKQLKKERKHSKKEDRERYKEEDKRLREHRKAEDKRLRELRKEEDKRLKEKRKAEDKRLRELRDRGYHEEDIRKPDYDNGAPTRAPDGRIIRPIPTPDPGAPTRAPDGRIIRPIPETSVPGVHGDARRQEGAIGQSVEESIQQEQERMKQKSRDITEGVLDSVFGTGKRNSNP